MHKLSTASISSASRAAATREDLSICSVCLIVQDESLGAFDRSLFLSLDLPRDRLSKPFRSGCLPLGVIAPADCVFPLWVNGVRPANALQSLNGCEKQRIFELLFIAMKMS